MSPARKARRLLGALTIAALITGGGLAMAPAAASAAPATSPVGTSGIGPETPVDTSGKPIGRITGVAQKGAAITLTAEHGAARITFLDAQTLRVEVDPSGTFSDPANTPQNDPARTSNIVVGAGDFGGASVSLKDGDVITLSTSAATLKIDKATSRMSLERADGTVLWKESAPITFGAASATQYLQRAAGEQFIGGGMQNGRSVHTDQTINVSRSTNWVDGGNPNAVPYYMSSAGYGVLRDTFAPGSYTFMDTTTTTHAEKRFDAFYFVGDYKQSLDSYTKLTGRPAMPPIYALEYGDADCYNRSSPTYSSSGFNDPKAPKQHTYDALQTAQAFVTNDMPGAWMLVNDGYGCEYTADPDPMDPANPGQGLTGTVKDIKTQTGLETGLWTQRSLTKQEYEVGTAGIALRKLDVAWIGAGYRMALTGCEAAHDGIEQYSDRRGTALMVEGWAGAQRCGMQWTGDHTGTIDALKWQIPALAGSGNAGLAFTTADIDGIWGGSTESYVRDLQWKAFAPALYSMSGWAPVDKRPWLYGDAATQINRKYLQLRQQLMPYIYSLSADAHSDGVSPMRSMPLEFPADSSSYSANAAYQFMLGESMLVAPVYSHTDTRNGIVLPSGERWVDYWSGDVRAGGATVNGYAAPLDTVPVFVKAGAIIPQGIVARNASLVPEDSALTLDIYPSGTSSFTLYEDAKVTRDYQKGESSLQRFDVTAPKKDAGDVVVTIGTRTGDYAGKAASRPYELSVHTGSVPTDVKLGADTLTHHADKAAFDAATSGWYYDTARGGVVRVKVGQLASGSTATVSLLGTSAVGGRESDAASAALDVQLPQRGYQGQSLTATVTFTNTGDKAKTGVKITPELPEGWKLESAVGDTTATVAAGATATAVFTVVPGTKQAGPVTVKAAALYRDASNGEHTVTSSNVVNIAYGSIATAYNNVSVTTVAGRATGDFDGGGASFSAEQLATAPTPAGGVKPGSTVTVNAGTPTEVAYTWPTAGPDVPNAVQPAGQTIALSGSGTTLAVLGSAAAASGVTLPVTITYTDGTVQTQGLFYPNWLVQPSGLGSATVAITSKGRNNKNNPNSPEYTNGSYQVYSNTIRLLPSKTVASVTLPTEARVKLFDWKIVNQPLPEPPHEDVFASDLAWMSATTGWGYIGKDVANKDATTSPDVPLTIAYTDANGNPAESTYTKGLGVHAASKVTYYLGGQCTRFTAQTGIEKGFNPKIIFSVDGDGKRLFNGTTLTKGMAPETVDIDVTGVDFIELNVDPTTAGAINGAHAIWGDAKFTCSEPATDTDAPVTTATVTPEAAASGWYTSTATVTLSAEDASEVQGTAYALDGGDYQLYEKPLVLGDGKHTLLFRSGDIHDNLEDEKSIDVNVDTTAPTVDAQVTDRTVTLTAADAGSGIASIEYSTDGSTWQKYEQPVTAPDAGLLLTYRATDVAGHVTAGASPVVIDPVDTPEPAVAALNAPETVRAGDQVTVKLTGFPGNTSVRVELHSTPIVLGTVTTDKSGVATLTATVPVNTPEGVHTLRAFVGDSVAASRPITVIAKTAPPTGTPSPSGEPGGTASTNPDGSPLATTGTDGGAMVATFLGALLVGVIGFALLRVRRARAQR